jgi:hypothetical protein
MKDLTEKRSEIFVEALRKESSLFFWKLLYLRLHVSAKGNPRFSERLDRRRTCDIRPETVRLPVPILPVGQQLRTAVLHEVWLFIV